MTEPSTKDRRPWPMTWVAASIAIFLVLYTFINIQFRKEDAPHLPYEEAQERKSQLFEFDMNGWKLLEAESGTSNRSDPGVDIFKVRERPQEGRLDQDLPMDLVTVIPNRPVLVGGIRMVEPFLTDDRFLEIKLVPEAGVERGVQLDGYLKEGHLIVLVVKSEQGADFGRSNIYRFGLSGDGFPAGPYSVALYTDQAVYEWTITVD